MYAIENDLGRFEADTEREAKRLLRKARKAHIEQERITSQNRTLARHRAEAQGYRLLSRKLAGEDMPRGWRVLTITDDTYPAKRVYVDGRMSFSIETEDGRAVDYFYGAQPVQYIENGAGFCMALVFQNPDTHQLYYYAVGIADGSLVLADLYSGISVADLERSL